MFSNTTREGQSSVVLNSYQKKKKKKRKHAQSNKHKLSQQTPECQQLSLGQRHYIAIAL